MNRPIASASFSIIARSQSWATRINSSSALPLMLRFYGRRPYRRLTGVIRGANRHHPSREKGGDHEELQAALRMATLLAACAALGATSARAQEEGFGQHPTGHVGVPRVETYGTSSTTNYVLQAYAFDPFNGDGANFIANNFLARGCSSSCGFHAAVMLPAGALIETIELEACDTDAAVQLTATLYRVTQLEGSLIILAQRVHGQGIPGCAFFPATLVPAHSVNNEIGTYIVSVVISGATSIATRFQAVRLIYRLQVSPAPGSASFFDVPTTAPQFRFVEALVAAGITSGCGGGNYCPNDPLTRGQMAVFLSVALGLHFPN